MLLLFFSLQQLLNKAMKKLILTLSAKTKIRLDLLLDTSKDLLPLETPFKTAPITALLTHHAIYSKPTLLMMPMVLVMDFADFSTKALLDATLLLLSV